LSLPLELNSFQTNKCLTAYSYINVTLSNGKTVELCAWNCLMDQIMKLLYNEGFISFDTKEVLKPFFFNGKEFHKGEFIDSFKLVSGD